MVDSRGLDALDQLAAEGFAVSRERYVETVKADRTAQFEKEFLSQAGKVKLRLVFRVGLPYDETIKTVVGG